jgi:hypothetical protein
MVDATGRIQFILTSESYEAYMQISWIPDKPL